MPRTRPKRKTGIGLLGKVTPELINELNVIQPAYLSLLGGADNLIHLLNSLNYDPDAAMLRLWWQHTLDTESEPVDVTPDKLHNLYLWASQTLEYGNHKVGDTVVRPEYSERWNEVWGYGNHIPERMALKWFSWTRGDWQKLQAYQAQRRAEGHTTQIYGMSFIAGLEGQSIDERDILFENEIANILPAQYDIKCVALNVATGRYADDQPLWDIPQMRNLLTALRQYDGRLGLHGYAHGSLMFEHGDAQVTPESPLLFPKEPYEYVRERKIYPYDMLGTWAAFLAHRVYFEELIPLGYGNVKIWLTEYFLDRVSPERQPEMKRVYYRNESPGGFWEYVWRTTGRISHWRYLKFLDPFLKAGDSEDLAGQKFAAEDLGWGELQLEAYDEIECALIFCGRADGDPSWSNYNVLNTGILSRWFEPAITRLRGGEPPPPPPPSQSGCLAWLTALLQRLLGK